MDHPELQSHKSRVSLDQLSEELKLVREIVLQAESKHDIQLFTQLRHLGDIRKALLLEDNDMGRRLLKGKSVASLVLISTVKRPAVAA